MCMTLYLLFTKYSLLTNTDRTVQYNLAIPPATIPEVWIHLPPTSSLQVWRKNELELGSTRLWMSGV